MEAITADVFGGPTATDGPASFRRRGIAAAIGLACLALLIVSATLRADEAGYGTHTQLGLPPCQLKVQMDMPCPSCGMTTAFALAADGRLISAVATQPFGALLALLTAMVLLVSIHVVVTGMNIGRWLSMVRPSRAALAFVGLFMAAWVFKIASYKGWFG
jgi:hypothetical protein